MNICVFLTRWILCCLLLVIIMPSTILMAQRNILENSVKYESGWLGIELSCSNTKVSIKDSITFDVKLINIGKKSLTIFNQLEWGYMAGLRMMIADEADVPVLSEVYDDYLTIPTLIFSPSSYVTLHPNHYLGTTRLDTAKNLFKNPGKYSVTVAYSSPAFESSVVKDTGMEIKDLWGRERVTITSSTIWIEVIGD